ncbi:acetoacetyl-CoA reductase [Herbaspirillum hiltneri N3]|uniref:Acetoacetyl-CoA reductase n=1 Tax=Herbaspirillum hiltneri N3 TaxID=1262470 RepID=A0ABM5V1M4_9BURK|nr:acetoacetyl-CoA reductase [Herbaspirillum hiltneri]AKZ63477.1 acetoacetyl-CoA reductase [Herbaspirillum hiltneri N3]
MNAKVALVTGGTRGLGAAIAIALRDAGYRVAAVHRSNADAARAFKEKTSIPVFCWDVSNFSACADGVRQVENEIGPIDVLINNAGITRDAVLHRMSPEQWGDVIGTNLGSVFNMSRNVIEGMRERGFGRIVNISSVNGERGQIGQANYAAAKAGILGFTKSLAQESARKNITVNAIAPGYCDTDMVAAVPKDVLEKIVATIPVGRLGNGGDIARLVVFLADDAAGFITGATLDINGGQFMA